MNDHLFSPQQLLVLNALSSGATMTAAAEQAGVHRNTVNNWRSNLPLFQQALSDAPYGRAMLFREKFEELADLAFQTIHDLLADPKTPAGVRLNAALAVIGTATTPPAPKKQIELDIEELVVEKQNVRPVHNSAQSTPSVTPVNQDSCLRQENPQTLHKNAQPTPEIVVNSSSFAAETLHNSAQPTPPPHFNAGRSKVGRNDACPCGSGRKYKRCCIGNPLAAAA